ncbi:HTH domain-containing protein [Natrialbaceae archaeon A-gly3]
MSETDPTTRYTITLWVRDGVSHSWGETPPIENRLQDLVEADVLSDFSVRVWGKQLVPDSDAEDCRTVEGEPIHETLARFRSWADREAHSLEPGFRTCERRPMLTEGTTSVIVPPLVCLAVYRDDGLVGVFPCSSDDGTKTVDDCLTHLAESGCLPADNETG